MHGDGPKSIDMGSFQRQHINRSGTVDNTPSERKAAAVNIWWFGRFKCNTYLDLSQHKEDAKPA